MSQKASIQTAESDTTKNQIHMFSTLDEAVKSEHPQCNIQLGEQKNANTDSSATEHIFQMPKNSVAPSELNDLQDNPLANNNVIQVGKVEKGGKQQDAVNPEEECFKAYLDYMKAVFIIQQVLDTIQIDNLLDYSEQSHVEFIFLVWTRVRNYLQTAYKLTKQVPINPNSKSELTNIEAYKFKATTKFKIYNQMLDEIRGKFGQKIGKLFHIKKSVGGKERFLDGFEGLDYTESQQIQFTYCNYSEIVLNSKEIKNQYFINHRFKKVLKGYRKICLLTVQNLSHPKDVLTRFNEIISDQ